jgi:uncharacterized tellurite resistance protein B-like protein
MNKAAAHVCNLIAMAIRDNDFDDEEKKVILKIASRLGLSHQDIEQILSLESLKIEVPLSIAERIQHLNDLVLVMLADGVIHEEEIKYIGRFIKMYGFEDNYDGQPISININKLKRQLPFQKFLAEYKKLTDEVLSSVVVDKDFKICLPSYKSELSNLGPLPKTLYIFFLIKKEPVCIVDLSLPENKRLMCEIYSLLPGSDFQVEEKINNLTNPDGLLFNSYRSIIKKSIINALPNDHAGLIKYYEITGSRNQKKYIALNRELVHIQPRLPVLI